MATLTIWTKPGTDEMRVYINTRFDVDASRLGIAYADGAYFHADENGMCRRHFQASMSGRYGEESRRFADLFMISDDLPFTDLIKRVEAAVGPRGAKFSEKVYFANLNK